MLYLCLKRALESPRIEGKEKSSSMFQIVSLYVMLYVTQASEQQQFGQCHSTGGWLLAYHLRGAGLVLGQSVWHVWWT